MILEATWFGYMAYEIVVVLPQVTKHAIRMNRKYKAFEKTATVIQQKDTYIPPTILFKQYRKKYLERLGEQS